MALHVTTQTAYRVKNEQFEGPLDLLLHLIEKRKFFINDISLSRVTDDYLRIMQEEGSVSKSDVTSFLQIASTLVLIKSRSLLPHMPLSEEEEGDIEDLESRLREHRRMKELSTQVEKLYGKNRLYQARARKMKRSVFAPAPEVNIESLFSVVSGVLMKLPEEQEKVPEARVRRIIRLEDVMNRLVDRVNNALSMSFRDFSKGSGSVEKADVIVSFIALLELVKSGTIVALQGSLYEDIQMRPAELDVPRYDTLG